jgi:hypothetical protein
MENKEKTYRFDYQPGRTQAELEEARFIESLKRTPTERFRIMMQLIRISQKTSEAVKKLAINKQ